MISIGTRLGSYEIVSPLGAGGMGVVYRARDTVAPARMLRLASSIAALWIFGRFRKSTPASTNIVKSATSISITNMNCR